MYAFTIIAVLLAITPFIQSSFAQEHDPVITQIQRPETTPEEEPLPTLTGNWGGFRTKLSNRGIDLNLVYKADVFRSLTGGVKKKTGYLDNLDLLLSGDTEKLVGWKGGSFLIYGLRNNGTDPTQYVGNAQSVDNIESPDTIRLFEAWVQQSLFDDRLSLLAGLHDLNADFYATETSRVFLNGSFGFAAEFGQVAPSGFPMTSFGGCVRYKPTPAFYASIAVFDGVPGDEANPKVNKLKLGESDGVLAIAELGYLRGKEPKSNNRYGKYGIGFWHETRPFDQIGDVDEFGNPTKGTNQGVYVLGEQAIANEVSLFARYGVASPKVNEIQSNLSGGVQFTGLIPRRATDRLGLAFTTAFASERIRPEPAPGEQRAHSNETVLEATYRAEIIPGLAVQPDYQYVINPGFAPGAKNASAFIARFELSL